MILFWHHLTSSTTLWWIIPLYLLHPCREPVCFGERHIQPLCWMMRPGSLGLQRYFDAFVSQESLLSWHRFLPPTLRRRWIFPSSCLWQTALIFEDCIYVSSSKCLHKNPDLNVGKLRQSSERRQFGRQHKLRRTSPCEFDGCAITGLPPLSAKKKKYKPILQWRIRPSVVYCSFIRLVFKNSSEDMGPMVSQQKTEHLMQPLVWLSLPPKP